MTRSLSWCLEDEIQVEMINNNGACRQTTCRCVGDISQAAECPNWKPMTSQAVDDRLERLFGL
jgi:hypothetical protein